MVDNSTSPMINELATSTIAKFVSCQFIDEISVIRCGGVRVMVNMAKWSTKFVNGPTTRGSIEAKTETISIITKMGFLLIMWIHDQCTIVSRI